MACLDGYLLQIKVPAISETGNVKAYFSGHYQYYGINVQAACDHKCRFVYAALAKPGGVNGIAAFRKTQLSQMIQKLPLRRFVVGDNAYVCAETLLTPFSDVEQDDQSKDAFDFYLSQMKIRIEQTFGIMTRKWRILHQLLPMHLKNFGRVFMCITRLQNFCINEGSTSVNITEENKGYDSVFMHSDVNETSIAGSSMLRDIIVQELAQWGLERPSFN